MPDGNSEDVDVAPIVVSKLKLTDVQRQIFAADLVEAPHNAALNQRPEAVDRLRMDRADDMLTSTVIDDRVREVFVKLPIGSIVVAARKADLGRNGFANEADQCGS